MSHAVVSRFTDADDEAEIPKGRGLGPDKPDHERKLEFVARERAVLAWGRLRGISELDSAQAEQILSEAILDAVVASRGPLKEQEQQVTMMKQAARALRAVVQRLWSESNGKLDLSKGSQKYCRLCGGTKAAHIGSCPVDRALRLAQQARVGED